MTSSARRAKRRTPPVEPVGEIEDIAVAASSAPEAAPAMLASEASGEN